MDRPFDYEALIDHGQARKFISRRGGRENARWVVGVEMNFTSQTCPFICTYSWYII